VLVISCAQCRQVVVTGDGDYFAGDGCWCAGVSHRGRWEM